MVCNQSDTCSHPCECKSDEVSPPSRTTPKCHVGASFGIPFWASLSDLLPPCTSGWEGSRADQPEDGDGCQSANDPPSPKLGPRLEFQLDHDTRVACNRARAKRIATRSCAKRIATRGSDDVGLLYDSRREAQAVSQAFKLRWRRDMTLQNCRFQLCRVASLGHPPHPKKTVHTKTDVSPSVHGWLSMCVCMCMYLCICVCGCVGVHLSA